MDEALRFLDYAREILPLWFQVAVIGIAGFALLGGAYALWKMRAKPEEEPNTWIRFREEEPRCRYCGGYRSDSYAYDDWEQFMLDVRDCNVCIDHILRRCNGTAPLKPPTPEAVLDARIEARLACARAQIYQGGSQPCPPCRELRV